MKNTVIGGCFALLAAVIAVLLGNHLTKENIDIRFTLSSSIPAKFLGEQNVINIQQLVIINKGDRTAEKIRIKLDGRITKYEITKYSEIDETEERLSEQSLEILYPELPPEGKLKIVFSSEYSTLFADDIDIYHSKGVAKEAFEDKDSFFLSYGSVFILYFVLVFLYLIVQILTTRNTWLERDANNGNEEVFKRKNSPIFMSQDRWRKLRKDAITNFIKANSTRLYNFKDSKIIEYLNANKPDYLNDDEWDLLIKEAQEKFIEMIPPYLERTVFYNKKIEDFFTIEKPINLQQHKWDKIHNKVQESFVFQQKETVISSLNNLNTADIAKKFNENGKSEVKAQFWDDYIKVLRKIYFLSLIQDLPKQYDDVIEYLTRQDLTVLEESQIFFLKKVASKFKYARTVPSFTLDSARRILDVGKEEWIEDDDYLKLKSIAERVIELHKEKSNTDSKSSLLNDIRFNRGLPKDKPEVLGEYEWKEIKDLEKGLVGLLNENKETLKKNEQVLEELKQKEKTIPDLINKINFQLSTVNEFLSDPTVLERIEDYNNTFSPGNLQNLKEIASYLKGVEKS